MPKLSKQTLEKRFSCSHCGQTFRTRQGLSGHIQFKHPSEAPAEENSYMQAVLDVFKFKQRAEIAGFNKEEISQMGQMSARVDLWACGSVTHGVLAWAAEGCRGTMAAAERQRQ